jgi:hypothetical protein
MYASATLNGKTVQGIVESVSFTNPGLLSVQVVAWDRLTFYQDLANINNLNTIIGLLD